MPVSICGMEFITRWFEPKVLSKFLSSQKEKEGYIYVEGSN
jgi:hypothetical protein